MNNLKKIVLKKTSLKSRFKLSTVYAFLISPGNAFDNFGGAEEKAYIAP